MPAPGGQPFAPDPVMSRAPIEIVPVTTRAEMDAFIRLPYRLHEGDPTWVPPLLMERREALDPANVATYNRKATGEKYLIDPSAGA